MELQILFSTMLLSAYKCNFVKFIWATFARGDFEARKKKGEILFNSGSYAIHACLDSVEGTTDLVFRSLFDDTLVVVSIIFSRVLLFTSESFCSNFNLR